jgi:hypothetical protein
MDKMRCFQCTASCPLAKGIATTDNVASCNMCSQVFRFSSFDRMIDRHPRQAKICVRNDPSSGMFLACRSCKASIRLPTSQSINVTEEACHVCKGTDGQPWKKLRFRFTPGSTPDMPLEASALGVR